MGANVLVIDDEESLRFTLERFLSLAGHSVVTAGTCREARERIDEGDFDLIFTDVSLPDGSGMDLLGEIRRRSPDCPVIVITAYPSAETGRETRRMGAFDCVTKPVRQLEVTRFADLALERKMESGAGKGSGPVDA
ncbi:MAG: response regulator [Syntrophobacteraceae bacterium]|nr:response regulator [Syntrophobacteraceae bacterium]